MCIRDRSGTGRLVQDRSEPDPEETDALRTAAGSWCICRSSGLCNRMEILQLDQPDAGYDRSVDRKYVSVP